MALRTSTSVALSLALSLAACVEPTGAAGDRVVATTSALAGTWLSRIQLASHGCPALGSALPFAPGTLELRFEDDLLVLRDGLARDQRYEAAGERRFWQRESIEIGGCVIDQEVTLTVDHLEPRSLTATYEARFRHDGSAVCTAYTSLASCTLVHRVEATRVSGSPGGQP